MVRISDILKKKAEAKVTPPEPAPAVETPAAAAKEPVTPPETKKAAPPPEQKPQELQIAKAMREIEPDMERSRGLYYRGVGLSKELLSKAEGAGPLEIRPLKDLVEEVINYFVLGNKTLFVFFHEDHAPEDYLYNHLVNVMIMAVAVGLKLGYNKSVLGEVGLAAFLHDIGMIRVKKITLLPRPLTDEEQKQVQQHPLYSVEILSKIKDIPEAVINAIKEQHERMDGGGYPYGLKGKEISMPARIIGTIDVYEALTHRRSYRKQLPAYEAIREMVSCASALFDPKIFKILIDLVGVYPIGSYAELNSSEIAKVVTPNTEFPLRPVVNIIFDANKNRLEEPRLVNLSGQFNLYIKRPLSDEEITRLVKE